MRNGGHVTDRSDAPEPGDVAEYIADMAGQLAAVAHDAGFLGTAAVLMRAQIAALSDLRGFQLQKAAPDDAA